MLNLLDQFLETRSRTVKLCAPLLIEDYIPQPAVFTSPPKWHLAHTSWFFEEMILCKFMHKYLVFDKEYSFLFNSYYNNIGELFPRNKRGMITRPNVEEVYQYRDHVDEAITRLLSSAHPDEVNDLLVLGINHAQQHQALLLTDLKFTLALNPTFPVYDINCHLVNDENETSGWLAIKEDLYDNLRNLMERHEITLLDDPEIRQSLRSIQYEFTDNPKSPTQMKIFGNYSHCVEAIIRAAWTAKEKSLNLWV